MYELKNKIAPIVFTFAKKLIDWLIDFSHWNFSLSHLTASNYLFNNFCAVVVTLSIVFHSLSITFFLRQRASLPLAMSLPLI